MTISFATKNNNIANTCKTFCRCLLLGSAPTLPTLMIILSSGQAPPREGRVQSVLVFFRLLGISIEIKLALLARFPSQIPSHTLNSILLNRATNVNHHGGTQTRQSHSRHKTSHQSQKILEFQELAVLLVLELSIR